MLTVILTAVTALFGALWRRWLGGWKPAGFEVSRIVKYAVLAAGLLPMLLLGVSPIQLALFAAVLIGGFSIGHGSWQDMGTMPRTRNGYLDPLLDKLKLGPVAHDFVGQATHYSLISVAGAIVLGAPLYALAGLVSALGYLAFSKLQPATKSPLLDAWTAYAELLLGAAMIGGAVLAI
jgi:hypothetical protein